MHGLALGQVVLDRQPSGKFRRSRGLEASTDLNTGRPKSVGAGHVTIRYDHPMQVGRGLSVLGPQGKFLSFSGKALTLKREMGAFVETLLEAGFADSTD